MLFPKFSVGLLHFFAWTPSAGLAPRSGMAPGCRGAEDQGQVLGGVLVLVLVEEKSRARKQNCVRSPQVAMRPFSAANAVHTRRNFSTVRDHLDRLGVETSIFGAWWKNLPNLDKAQFSEIWTRLIPHRSRMTVHFFCV